MASITTRNVASACSTLMLMTRGTEAEMGNLSDTTGSRKQRKAEIEYSQQLGTFTIPNCTTVSELLSEYVSLYGKTKWSISAYTANTALIAHYIEPHLGNMRLREITARSLEKYYQTLLKTPAVHKMTDRKSKKTNTTVTPSTVRRVHSLLRSAFNQAEKWDLVDKNPARYATVPKAQPKEREIWDASTLFQAIECCEDERLKLCLNLAFACSLRIGELLGLTWDCVDISEESMMKNEASIYINKELQQRQ